MNIVNKRFISLIIGIILLVIALFMNSFNLLRAILCLLSIILLTYSNQLERTNKRLFSILFVIIFSLFVISLDYLFVAYFKKTPILTYNIVSSEYGTVYNAIGYRVWKCSDKSFKVDPLYKLGYYCEKESMSSENINNVLSTIINNFDQYKGSYVKIIGRVSNVIDNTKFYMQSYKEEDNMIKFDETNKLYVEFNYANNSVLNLETNAIVTVVGKIDRKVGNDIFMIDSTFNKETTSSGDVTFGAESNIYCEYDKELWFQTSDNIYYKSCIDDVNITIGSNQYNLQNAMRNNLITLQEIEDESLGYQKQSKDDSTMYNFKDFKILVCDPKYSTDVIVGKTTMEFSDGYCNVYNDDRGV
ncbi:MAG: hypothetical protein IJ572_04530 [Bacilli bacterium]|nr:hypothetical protein [Bacilli bacterium]